MPPKQPRPVLRLALNQQEAAAALGVSVTHFERHIKHELPVVLSGARKIYPVSGIEKWLARESLRAGRRAG